MHRPSLSGTLASLLVILLFLVAAHGAYFEHLVPPDSFMFLLTFALPFGVGFLLIWVIDWLIVRLSAVKR
jgi:hypothetical protein